MNKIIIDTTKLAKYCLGIRMRVIKKTLLSMDIPQEKKYVEYILSLLEENKTGKRIDLRGVIVRRDYDKLIIENEKMVLHPDLQEWILPPQGKLELPDCIIETEFVPVKSIKSVNGKIGSKNTVYFDMDNLLLPLKIRHRRAGDVFIPFGFKGKKKLKDVFIDDKISVYKRASIQLVVDANGNILWIVGYRRSNIAPITGATQKVLKINFLSRPYLKKKTATSTPTIAPAKTSKRV
ncbi:MAG: tRNA lysidine(34) synthetase TilS [bacterium]|nr:tRNA lysidine(34) synthetase TilS [bacterium]